MNIILIGYRCCGKTSVGKALAKRLGRKFIDTDEFIIKKAGSSIDAMVSKHGWEYFRTVEKEAVKEISLRDNLVIATGGGVVTDNENTHKLKSNGIVIWLYADIDIIKQRLLGDASSAENRPSLTGTDPADEISRVLEERKPLYADGGDFAVDTGTLNIDDAVDEIIERIGKRK